MIPFIVLNVSKIDDNPKQIKINFNISIEKNAWLKDSILWNSTELIHALHNMAFGCCKKKCELIGLQWRQERELKKIQSHDLF